MSGPLAGRTALVTGASRRRGIGYATAVELASRGASVVIHHFAPHDRDQPWGDDDLDAVRRGVGDALVPGALMADVHADLADSGAPAHVVREAAGLTGTLDILVCNQARSGGDGALLDLGAAELDAHWNVNTRATLLLTAEFARLGRGESGPALRPGERRPGNSPIDAADARRVFWMTSGQQDGPMPGEVAYATSKAALAGITRTVASELLPLGIILNTINPGPVNTGYLDADTADRPLDDISAAIAATPFGRVGVPADPARLIGWLASPEGAWIAGQVLTSDGGFSVG
jgi:3-oxoacyl-[acyl-carrier protein] reductase